MRKSVVALILLLSACASPSGPSPEELARADQIRAGTEATAMSAALSIKNRIADATAVAPATATVMAARVNSDVALSQATAVVVTARAGSDVTSAQAKPAKDWLWFAVLLFLVASFGLGLYWFGMKMRRASMVYGKTATGVVGLDESGRLFNSSTMVESTITSPSDQADLLFQIERVRHYLATGQVLALPEAQKPLLTDGNATAEQRARVATVARTGDALAAAMNSKISERERLERMELLRGRSGARQGLMEGGLGGPALPAPETKGPSNSVLIVNPSEADPYLQLIGSTYGVPPKLLADKSREYPPIIDQAPLQPGNSTVHGEK